MTERQDDRHFLLTAVKGQEQKFKETFRKYIGANVLDSFISSHESNMFYSKENIIDKLKTNFKKGAYRVFIYYSGPANNNGDWTIGTDKNKGGDLFTFEEIRELYKKERQSQRCKLYLFMDSSYSGKWCQKVYQNKEKDIAVFAACSPNEDIQNGQTLNKFLFDKNIKFGQVFKNQTPYFVNEGSNPQPLFKSFIEELQKGVCQAENISYTWSGSSKFYLRQGKGKIVFKDGSVYHGDWKGDRKQGQGQYIEESGEKYEGKWENDQMHGQGIYYLLTGIKYKGNWVKGKLNGQGTLYFGQLNQNIKKQLRFENGVLKN